MENLQRQSVIEVTPTTLQDYFGILIEAVRNGELNPLELYGKAKEIEATVALCQNAPEPSPKTMFENIWSRKVSQ